MIKDTFRSAYRERRLFLYFAAVSFLLLLICTRSSFLYPYNNWDDANSYFSMGKSMFRGTVIYRDLFDQKGPYLYFLYGLCSLVSYTDFTGVFLMEVILGILDLACMYGILRLYLKKGTALSLLPFVFGVSFSSFSFYWGGCAEEICLPFLLLPMYIVLRHEKNASRAPYAWDEIIAAGLCCGFSACVKFTLLGYYFAFMVLVMFHSKGILRFLKSCAVFLIAMAVPALPWIVYFGIIGALDDWYRVYVYTNVFLYSTFGANDKGESLYDKVYNMAKILYWLFWDNFQYFAFVAAGMAFMLFRKHAALLERLCLIILFGFTFLGIYIGGSHLPYYAFPLTVFAPAGFIAAGTAAEKILKKDMAGTGRLLIPAACTAAALVLVFVLTPNRYYLSYGKEDVFLSRFAGDIKKDGLEEPTLLNYNCLDCGLYTAAGIVPTCYWFQTQTLPIEDVYIAQHGYMKEGATDYVVVRDGYPEFLTERYEEIDTFYQVMGEAEHEYHLFRRRDDR